MQKLNFEGPPRLRLDITKLERAYAAQHKIIFLWNSMFNDSIRFIYLFLVWFIIWHLGLARATKWHQQDLALMSVIGLPFKHPEFLFPSSSCLSSFQVAPRFLSAPPRLWVKQCLERHTRPWAPERWNLRSCPTWHALIQSYQGRGRGSSHFRETLFQDHRLVGCLPIEIDMHTHFMGCSSSRVHAESNDSSNAGLWFTLLGCTGSRWLKESYHPKQMCQTNNATDFQCHLGHTMNLMNSDSIWFCIIVVHHGHETGR